MSEVEPFCSMRAFVYMGAFKMINKYVMLSFLRLETAVKIEFMTRLFPEYIKYTCPTMSCSKAAVKLLFLQLYRLSR